MDIQSGIAPPASPPLMPSIKKEEEPGQSKFSRMLHEVEGHRARVQTALAVALLARLLFEFQFASLLKNSSNLLVQVPYIGLALLAYLLVLMWLAGRTRDRFGFGMALGIGVLEATYLLVAAVMQRPFSFGSLWPPLVVAIAHVRGLLSVPRVPPRIHRRRKRP